MGGLGGWVGWVAGLAGWAGGLGWLGWVAGLAGCAGLAALAGLRTWLGGQLDGGWADWLIKVGKSALMLVFHRFIRTFPEQCWVFDTACSCVCCLTMDLMIPISV